MAGYVIAEVEITDPATFDEYRQQVPSTIAKFGGKFLVRGGATDSIEGGWKAARLVVIEFPSVARAREWYESADYAPLLDMRLRAARTKLIFAEGV